MSKSNKFCNTSLVCLLWLGWATGAWARPLYLDYFHVAPPHRALKASEKKLDARVRRWFRSHRLSPPRFDVGLREASWRLADVLSHHPSRQLHHPRVKAALWLGGSSDHQIRIFGMVFKKFPTLWRSLSQKLVRTLGGMRPTHLGFAIVGKTRRVCLILFVRRDVQLAPLTRWVRKGQRVQLGGTLQTNARTAEVVVGLPDGKVKRFRLRADAQHQLRLGWKAREVGFTRFQVVTQGARGPHITAQWDLQVLGTKDSLDKSWRGAWKFHLARLWKGQTTGTPTETHTSGKQAAARLFALVNQHRKRSRLAVLRRDIRLDKLAQRHAQDMVRGGFFGHTSPQSGTFGERFGRLQWMVKSARENIVVAPDAPTALKLLRQSPGHKQNLLLPKARLTGIAATRHPSGRYYFVQIFVAP